MVMAMKQARMMAAVGSFIILGGACMAYLTVTLGKLELAESGYYEVYGEFDSVTGLKEGAPVEIAGVVLGKVDRITLNPQTDQAVVAMKIRQGVKVTDDAIASVRTEGIIGDRFIALTPGGSDRILADNGRIIDTESALDVTELLKKFLDSRAK
jgi:phospholipid/cholesterol/gamma-HCH transport system substrate-binding protein